jgi:hypothetical protein
MSANAPTPTNAHPNSPTAQEFNAGAPDPTQTPLPTLTPVQQEPQAGGKPHKKHNGRNYVVRTGSRGGKYILVKGNKVYV